MKKLGFALVALLLGSTGWGQAVFNKYGPANGFQLNTGNTYQNTTAAITDFQTALSPGGLVLGGASGGAKGTGSVNATALFINGAAVGTSSGAVSSVALGAPGACFGVTGSPVTSAGTLAYTLSGASSGILRADGSCSNTPVVIAAPSSGVAETVTGVAGSFAAVFNGATTTGQSRGIQILAGTNASDHALVVDNQAGTIDYFTIQGDGSTTLGYNGTNAAIVTAAAGNVTIHAPSSGIALASSGAANGFAGQFIGSSTTGQSRGLQVNAGTNSSDFAFQVNNQANSITYLQVSGNGAISMGPAANSLLVNGTTGGVTINAPSSGQALTVTGAAGGANAVNINGSATTGQSNGLLISAGTNVSDTPFAILNHAQSIVFMSIRGDGSGAVGPTGAALSWSAGGNVTVAAPASGVAFSSTGIASQYAGLFTGGGAAGTQKGLSAVTTTQNAADKILNVNNSASNLLDIFGDGHGDLGPNLSWTVAGNFTIGVPTSGIALSVGATDNGTAILINDAVGTNGFAAFTLENAGTPRGQFGLGPAVQTGASAGDVSVVANTGSMNFGNGATIWGHFASTGGVQIGSPTGGDKGAGSINAQTAWVNGNTAHGEQCAYKTSTTARSSNTTPTADPDLTVTLAVGGTYVLDMWIEINATSGGTQGFQFAFDGTAATGGLQGGRGTSGYINGAVFALPEASINNTIQNIATISTTVNDWLHVSGTWTGFSAGTFFLKWAQNTSNVSSTNVLAGAYMCVKQIG